MKKFIILYALFSLSSLAGLSPVKAQGQAAAFGWGSTIESNYSPDEIFNDNFTVSIWFMQKYPGAYMGTMFCTDTRLDQKVFSIGQQGFHQSGLACKTDDDGTVIKTGETALYVRMGIKRWDYPVPVLRTPGRWHHLALVKIRSKFSLYLDGEVLQPADNEAEIVPNRMSSRGPIHLGNSAAHREQFYGLLDNFSLYKSGLSPSDVKSLASRQPPAHLANEILTEANFDSGLPAGWQKTPACILVPSAGHHVPDRAKMLPPNHTSTFYVPFPAGEIWKVIQGQDNYGGVDNDCGSHYGNWSFSVDMIRAGKGISKQSQTENEVAISGCRGIVDTVVNHYNNVEGDVHSNYVKILAAPEEYISFLHIAKESNVLKQGEQVEALDYIALVSDIGSPGAHHIHQSLTTAREKDDAVSRPFAWSNYEYSRDQGRTWKYAQRRQPLNGDWVRNTVSRQKKSGKLVLLRVNELNTKFKEEENQQMDEVVVQLQGEHANKAYGFQLRNTGDRSSRMAMLDQLRTAFRLDKTVTLTYDISQETSMKRVLVNVELH